MNAVRGERRRSAVPRTGSRGRDARTDRLTGRLAHVYAIVGARGPSSVRTRSSGRLDVISQGALAAVVRLQPGVQESSPAHLRRYERTIRELSDRFPAVLPARFGTVMPVEELAFILSSRSATLSRALSNVRGRTQMTIRIVGGAMDTREVRKRTASAEAPPSRRGREYLRARLRESTVQRKVPGFEPVRSAVARWVRDERVEHRDGISTVYHLIPRAAAERYRTASQRAAAAAGLPAVVSGPWPPYAFAASD